MLPCHIPAVQSINQTSGYMEMYRTISLVAKDLNTIIDFDSLIPQSRRSLHFFDQHPLDRVAFHQFDYRVLDAPLDRHINRCQSRAVP